MEHSLYLGGDAHSVKFVAYDHSLQQAGPHLPMQVFTEFSMEQIKGDFTCCRCKKDIAETIERRCIDRHGSVHTLHRAAVPRIDVGTLARHDE